MRVRSSTVASERVPVAPASWTEPVSFRVCTFSRCTPDLRADPRLEPADAALVRIEMHVVDPVG